MADIFNTVLGDMQKPSTKCPICRGSTKDPKDKAKPCPKCNGKGSVGYWTK